MSSQDDAASTFLAPGKSSSRQTLSNKRSWTSLHGDGATKGASLAHELAAALMPEPTTGSRLLADEFGIEFDEGAEGIDDRDVEEGGRGGDPHVIISDDHLLEHSHHRDSSIPNGDGLALTGPDASDTSHDAESAQKDPLIVLNDDLENANLFIEHLRRLDAESPSTQSHTRGLSSETTLERLASDLIRRLGDTSRERESQIRKLREIEKEFKRIASQGGDSWFLSGVDEPGRADGFTEEMKEKEIREDRASKTLNTVMEEEETSNADWDLDAKRTIRDEDLGEYYGHDRQDSLSRANESTSLLPPPPSLRTPTPENTVSQMAYLRTLTQSLISSLSAVVEHTQVTGAATAEAGRKIRALKNKFGDWRRELEDAEKSMARIHKWETEGAGSLTGISVILPNGFSPGTRQRLKPLMQEQVKAVDLVVAELGRKAQEIRVHIDSTYGFYIQQDVG